MKTTEFTTDSGATFKLAYREDILEEQACKIVNGVLNALSDRDKAYWSKRCRHFNCHVYVGTDGYEVR